MNDIVKIWLKKAESDLKSAQILLDAEEPLTDAICFHAQQAVEKLLKAFLTRKDIKAGRTHDIATLLAYCINIDDEFKTLPQEKLERLTFYAVEVRYPDDFYVPTIEEAKEAVKIAEEVMDFIIRKIG